MDIKIVLEVMMKLIVMKRVHRTRDVQTMQMLNVFNIRLEINYVDVKNKDIN